MQSLSTRLAVIISSIILVLVVLLAVWIDRVLTQAIQEQGVEQVDVHAQSLLGSLKTLMLTGNGTLAREWLDRLHGVGGIEDIEVIRRNGEPAFTDLATVEKVNEYLGQPRFQRTIRKHNDFKPVPEQTLKKVISGQVAHDLSHPGVFTVVLPIQADVECLACHGYDDTLLRGALKLSVSTQATTQRISNMKALLWFGAVFLIAALVLAVWFSMRQSVIKPIAALRKAIMSFGEGNRMVKPPVASNDELGDLANVFATMQKDINTYEARIRAVMDNVMDGIVTITNDGIIDAINPAMEHIFNYQAQELIGRHIDILIPEEKLNETFLLQDVVGNSKNVLVGVAREITGRKKNGSLFPMDVAVSDMRIEDKRYFIAIVRDITSRKARIAALHYQAMHDALTDLPNRTLLLDRLQQAIHAAERDNTQLTLALIDLDRFKEVNDTLGHHVGDKLLQQISKRLKLILRESDTVARLGGDEFCLLLTAADTAKAMFIARKIISAVEKTIYIEGHGLSVGASLGLATYPIHGQSPLLLLQRADVAMYVAKRGNKGFTVYDPNADQHSLRQLAIGSELKDAIENDQLTLYYQPKIDLKDYAVSGVEVLLRWRHPQHGLLLPDEFIPLAEQTGLIRSLTIWVLHNALKECQRNAKLGREINMSINLSMKNLADLSFIDEILSILNQYEISSGQLKLEITESSLMENPGDVISALNYLNDRGLRISIDDFGIGYSSLTYLQQLPVKELKIDKSFGLSLSEDNNSAVIVRSTIDLAHKLGLQVVAEGVESRETLELLEKLGCDQVQGFYLGRPMPMQEMLDWVEESEWREEREDLLV